MPLGNLLLGANNGRRSSLGICTTPISTSNRWACTSSSFPLPSAAASSAAAAVYSMADTDIRKHLFHKLDLAYTGCMLNASKQEHCLVQCSVQCHACTATCFQFLPDTRCSWHSKPVTCVPFHHTLHYHGGNGDVYK